MSVMERSIARVLARETTGAAALTGAAVLGPGWLDKLIEAARRELGDDAWRWFHEHEEDVLVVIRQKVIFFTVHFTVRVKHARALVEALAGPEPEPVL